MHNTYLFEFERSMIGIAHGEEVTMGEKSYAVPEELKTFGKECKRINVFHISTH